MKTAMASLVCILLCTCGCELFEDNISFGLPHEQHQRYGRRTEAPGEGDEHSVKRDTNIYLSAVRMPAGYDWRRDSAYGAVDAELVLLKNFDEVVCIPTGSHVSSAADRHHIVGGHLYTERQSSSRTFIGCDGKELISLSGREELKGVLEHDGILYTLTSPIGKNGFTLRAGESVLMMKNEGDVFGDMQTPSYLPNGALYADDGKVCFCYRSQGGYYKVQDGKETMLKGLGADTNDIRIVDGSEIAVSESFQNLGIAEGRIWTLKNGYAISGIGKASGRPAIYRSKDRSTQNFSMFSDPICYVGEEHAYVLGCSREGTITFHYDKERRNLEGEWYFFSPACAALGSTGPAIALTPKTEGKPAVLYDGKMHAVEINGYLTGINIEIK